MHVPDQFRESTEAAFALIDAHPLATIVVVNAERQPVVNHIPLLLDRKGDDPPRLVGHMSRKNPLWRLLATCDNALAIFHGPHAYISPSWYEQHDVPTWNYTVAHVRGPVRLIEEQRGLVRILAQLTDKLERGVEKPWQFGMPDDLAGPGQLAEAIIGFEIAAAEVTCKMKLGQNRAPGDREGAVRGLEQRGDDMSRAVAAMMRR